MMTPVGLAMLFRVFPPAERVRAASILTIPTTLAPALGPIIGGLLVTGLSWRWVFYVNLPLGLLALAFGAIFLAGGDAPRPGPFDLLGFLLAGAGLGLLMYGLSEGPVRGWSDGAVRAAVAAGAVLLAVLVPFELRKRDPLIDLRLLSDRLFRSTSAVMFLASAAFIGTLYVVSLYFQDGRSLSALGSGLSTFPEALGVMAGAQLTSRFIYPALGPRRNIAIGLTGVSVSIALMTLIGAQTSLWWMRLLMFCLGVAMGQVFVPAQAAAFATISPAATGRASTLFNVCRQLGSAVGVAIFTSAIVAVGATRTVAGHLAPDLAAYHVAFGVAAAVAAAGAVIALTIRDSDAAATINRRKPKNQARDTENGTDGVLPVPAAKQPGRESRALAGALGNRADHALAEAGRADAERQIEAAPEVLQRDHMGELHDLGLVETLPQAREQLVGHVHRGPAHPGGVVQDERVEVAEELAGLVAGQRQQFGVGEPESPRDRRAQVDAVLARRERGGLEFGQGAQARLHPVLPGGGLLKAGVAAEQPGQVRVHLQRREHALRRASGEPGEAPAGEVAGDPGV